MAYTFGDGFDCYATTADALAGYWDSGAVTNVSLIAGRFSGGQALRFGNVVNPSYTKSSGQNDGVHHLVLAFRNNDVLTGTTARFFMQLLDGTTGQCCVVFRSDGAILLTSGTPTGTTLATYTGAVSAQSTWTAFEIEVIVSNTVGGMRVRKNGNTSNDYDSFTAIGNLDTATTANNYANKLTLGVSTGPAMSNDVDDLLWRSDASSVPWVGDIRCYTRMPASDVQAQFARAPVSVQQFYGTTMPFLGGPAANVIWSMPITSLYSGSVSSLFASFGASVTGHVNMALYDNSGAPGSGMLSAGSPGALLAQATPITNPSTGLQTFTLVTPYSITKGTQYWVAMFADASLSTAIYGASSQNAALFNATYPAGGAFPSSVVGSVLTIAHNGFSYVGLGYNTTSNSLVNETLQDTATSYVYDSTVGHSDLYGIAALTATPASVVAVTTRGFVQKSDAGTRNGAVQLKSGAATVQSTSTALSTSWGWLWRTDATDPATGSAWTPVAVSNVNIGPVVTA